ncbi:MAG: OmpH family outer membrane protein [Bacteroidales bacterium]|nr:OmpH family outer membrane protein [Bacteroidales bacterium]
MKKAYVIASALAAVVLAGGLCSCNNGQQPSAVSPMAVTEGRLPLAYINVDSLLSNYDFAKDLNEELIKKNEDIRMNVNSKAQALEKKFADFQKKLQTNAFLSQERAEKEANNLQREKDELEQLNYKLQTELAQEQAVMNGRLSDTIRAFIKEYNKEMNFELILSNTMYDNVIIDNPKYDITGDVLKRLNERYAATKK